jgi:hypothetical protein
MALGVMKTAKGVSTVVPGAAVARVREQHVATFVIANPLITAFGLYEIASLSTEATAAPCGDLAAATLCCRGLLLDHGFPPALSAR